MEVGARPGLVQRPGVAERARHVVAAVHDRAGDVLQLPGVTDELPFLEPSRMDEEVVLDAREGDGEVVLAEGRAQRRIGQQRDRFTFPDAPGAGAFELYCSVG